MGKEYEEIKAEISVRISTEDIDDIVTTALEGGICYWCRRAEVKEQIAELYKSFGMPIIKNMMEAANYAETLDRAMAQAQRQVEELRKRIIRVAKGDLVVEQCITEAKKLFETVNNPHEWDVAVSYLKKRYGADAVDEAIKIEHLEM